MWEQKAVKIIHPINIMEPLIQRLPTQFQEISKHIG
jgi:hypothetical protein